MTDKAPAQHVDDDASDAATNQSDDEASDAATNHSDGDASDDATNESEPDVSDDDTNESEADASADATNESEADASDDATNESEGDVSDDATNESEDDTAEPDPTQPDGGDASDTGPTEPDGDDAAEIDPTQPDGGDASDTGPTEPGGDDAVEADPTGDASDNDDEPDAATTQSDGDDVENGHMDQTDLNGSEKPKKLSTQTISTVSSVAPDKSADTLATSQKHRVDEKHVTTNADYITHMRDCILGSTWKKIPDAATWYEIVQLMALCSQPSWSSDLVRGDVLRHINKKLLRRFSPSLFASFTSCSVDPTEIAADEKKRTTLNNKKMLPAQVDTILCIIPLTILQRNCELGKPVLKQDILHAWEDTDVIESQQQDMHDQVQFVADILEKKINGMCMDGQNTLHDALIEWAKDGCKDHTQVWSEALTHLLELFVVLQHKTKDPKQTKTREVIIAVCVLLVTMTHTMEDYKHILNVVCTAVLQLTVVTDTQLNPKDCAQLYSAIITHPMNKQVCQRKPTVAGVQLLFIGLVLGPEADVSAPTRKLLQQQKKLASLLTSSSAPTNLLCLLWHLCVLPRFHGLKKRKRTSTP